jgi:hypothetical protein
MERFAFRAHPALFREFLTLRPQQRFGLPLRLATRGAAVLLRFIRDSKAPRASPTPPGPRDAGRRRTLRPAIMTADTDRKRRVGAGRR